MMHIGIEQARETLAEWVHRADAAVLLVKEPCISPSTEVEFTSLIAPRRHPVTCLPQ